MGVNGVSHHVVADDLEGAAAVLHWLSSMPPTLGVPPALLPTSDPLDRGIGYTAPSGMQSQNPAEDGAQFAVQARSCHKPLTVILLGQNRLEPLASQTPIQCASALCKMACFHSTLASHVTPVPLHH